MNDAVDADTAPLRRCCRAACVVAALAAGALNAAEIAVVPQAQAQAQTQPAGAGDDAQAVAGGSWCSMLPPGFGHPPVNPTPVTLQVLQRSVEPVPATDGLVHLPYAAQVTNTLATPANILDAGGIPVERIERGGEVTYHGPGQLMVYPVVRLRSVVGFLERVAGAIAETCAELGA